ncbi:hypothetical protein CspHIS471_0307560 [Cutaneotrichosporon sp. HIS471]|nr:hypothetical protein CspHIS471_0307560 [Cutaneotrichosporon sp. HIS471]
MKYENGIRLITGYVPKLALTVVAIAAYFLLSACCFFYICTFLIQAGGGGMTAIESMASTGEKIALIGLIIQCVSFGLFWVLLVVFAFRLRSNHSNKWASGSGLKGWKALYWALQWTCIGIMVRCVFRVVEFSQGYSGYLRTTEWCYYVLDTLPLFLAIVVWAVVWPPRILVESDKWTGTHEHEHGHEYDLTSMGGSTYGPITTGSSYDKA